MSAALSYYAMLSIAPTLVIAIAIAGYVFDKQVVEQEIIRAVSQVTTEEIAKIIAGVIGRAQAPESGVLAGSISIVVLIVGASGVFNQLVDTFNAIWHVKGRQSGFWITIKTRLVGVSMVLVVGLTIIAALILQSLIGYLDQFVHDYPLLVTWLRFVDRSLTFLLLPVVFTAMFWLFPSARISLVDVLPAGFLTAFLVGGSRYFIQLYLDLSSTSEVYGATGSLVVMLIWVYLLGMIVFLGASFSCSWAHTFGSQRAELLAQQAEQDMLALERDAGQLVPERRNEPASSADASAVGERSQLGTETDLQTVDPDDQPQDAKQGSELTSESSGNPQVNEDQDDHQNEPSVNEQAAISNWVAASLSNEAELVPPAVEQVEQPEAECVPQAENAPKSDQEST